MDLEARLDNRTPMAVRCFRLEDRRGRDVAVVVAKLTYEVPDGGELRIAIPKSPIRRSDEPQRPADLPQLGLPGARPAQPSPRYPDDWAEERPGTSVLLVGTAYPQGDVNHQDVSLKVTQGRRQIAKLVRVYGPRIWQGSRLSVTPGPASRLAPTPIVYELAYGGADLSDPGSPLVEERNPVGLGVARSRASLIGLPAPRIEDLAAPIGSAHQAPAGFGPIAAQWSPRAGWLGTCDAAWRRERAPVRPLDFDPRHHCPAPPDQWSAEPLEEDASVQVLAATPEGRWSFMLPRYGPRFHAVLRGQEQEHPTHLDTLLLDADARRVELSWRVAIPLPRKAAFLEAVTVYSASRLPAGMLEDLARRLRERGQAHGHPTG